MTALALEKVAFGLSDDGQSAFWRLAFRGEKRQASVVLDGIGEAPEEILFTLTFRRRYPEVSSGDLQWKYLFHWDAVIERMVLLRVQSNYPLPSGNDTARERRPKAFPNLHQCRKRTPSPVALYTQDDYETFLLGNLEDRPSRNWVELNRIHLPQEGFTACESLSYQQIFSKSVVGLQCNSESDLRMEFTLEPIPRFHMGGFAFPYTLSLVDKHNSSVKGICGQTIRDYFLD